MSAVGVLDGRRPARGAAWPVALAGVVGVAGISLAIAAAPSHTVTPAAPAVAPVTAAHAQQGWSAVPEAAQLAISRSIGADQSAFHVHAGVALVAAQSLSARFGADAVEVRVPGGTATLGLRGATGAPVIAANRVSYRHGAVSEWYANGPFGLEQGFTLSRGASPVLALASGGTLTPQITGGGTGLALRNAAGRTLLTESGLSAWDARGRHLAVRFGRLSDGGLAITVNTRGAAFPVTVDPLVQAATLTATDGYANEGNGATINGNGIASGGLGYSAAIDGQTIAVGAPGASVTYGPGLSSTYPSGVTNSYQGAVYVFTEPAAGWASATQTAKLFASDGLTAGGSVSSGQNVYGDSLGSKVAVVGDTIVTSAPRAVAGSRDYAGKLYVFTKPSGGWVTAFQNAELAASNATADDFLGDSLAFDGQTIVSAVPNRENSGAASEAYIWAKPSGGWASSTESAQIHDSTYSTSDDFGGAVAVSGATVAVGAPAATDGGATDAGAVDVVTRSGSTWSSSYTGTRLTPASPVAYEAAGSSVALDGTTLVAGAPRNSGPGQSSVYVWSGSGAPSGTPTARLSASDATGGQDYFGRFVSVSGTTIQAVGYGSGAAALYSYTEPASGWANATQNDEATLTGSAGAYNGAGFASQSGTVVSGVPGGTASGKPTASGYALVYTTGTAAPPTTTTATTPATTTPPATNTTPATTTPPATDTPAPSTTGSTLTFTSTPVATTQLSTNDIIAGLFGLDRGSGETENLGDFTFVAYCNKPAGQCAASTSFGQQLGTNTAAHRVGVDAKKKKPKPIIWGTGSIKISAKHHASVKVKLTKLGRTLLARHHVLKGQLKITIGKTSKLHNFTLHYKPKKTKKK